MADREEIRCLIGEHVCDDGQIKEFIEAINENLDFRDAVLRNDASMHHDSAQVIWRYGVNHFSSVVRSYRKGDNPETLRKYLKISLFEENQRIISNEGYDVILDEAA